MTDLSPEELLSAYVDGELSPEERRRVEAHLAASAESRQLVDELRALGQLVRSLPRQTIGTDLSQRVMRRAAAERPFGAGPAADVERDANLQPAERAHRRSILRPLVWSGLAVAAALLVMVLGEPPATDRAPMAQRHGAQRHGAEKVEGDEAATAAEGPQDEARVVGLSGAERLAAGRPADREPAVMRSALAKPAPMEEMKETVAAEAAGGGVPSAAPAAAAPPDDRPVASLRFVEAPPDRAIVATAEPEKGLVATKSAAESAADILVVHLAVHRSALRRQAVTAVLAHQGIAWEGPPSGSSPAADQDQRQLAKLAETLAAADGSAHAQRGKEQRGKELSELIYVEATPAQVEGAIAEFEEKPDQFAEVLLGMMPVDQLTKILPAANTRTARGVDAGLRRAEPSAPEQAEAERDQPRRSSLQRKERSAASIPAPPASSSAPADRLMAKEKRPEQARGEAQSYFADKHAAARGRADAKRAEEGLVRERVQRIRREELGRMLRRADGQRNAAEESAGATDLSAATGRPVQVLFVIRSVDDSGTPAAAAADENP